MGQLRGWVHSSRLWPLECCGVLHQRHWAKARNTRSNASRNGNHSGVCSRVSWIRSGQRPKNNGMVRSHLFFHRDVDNSGVRRPVTTQWIATASRVPSWSRLCIFRSNCRYVGESVKSSRRRTTKNLIRSGGSDKQCANQGSQRNSNGPNPDKLSGRSVGIYEPVEH